MPSCRDPCKTADRETRPRGALFDPPSIHCNRRPYASKPNCAYRPCNVQQVYASGSIRAAMITIMQDDLIGLSCARAGLGWVGVDCQLPVECHWKRRASVKSGTWGSNWPAHSCGIVLPIGHINFIFVVLAFSFQQKFSAYYILSKSTATAPSVGIATLLLSKRGAVPLGASPCTFS